MARFRPRLAALKWEKEMRRFARKNQWAAAAQAAHFACYWWEQLRIHHEGGPYRSPSR